MIGTGEAANTASPPFGVIHPCWLIANGDTQRVAVLRSPLVKECSSMYQPVRQHIEDHGLVLTARETFEDEEWMYGRVEMSVFVTPASRNASYARTMC